MPLDAYRARRNFQRTPEPPGHGDPASRRHVRHLAFVVQKHLASHLHYDLRLEHDGVLWSWAVPKGPSLDPRDRRLAIHVEDHPLDYGDFEGVIPEGYGAGIVMLWDRGQWRPEVAHVGKALEEGDLKFRLEGYKLRGSWALVRTRGGDGRSWLLIKHRDEWAASREALDITAFAPRSVRSDGDFVDILAAGDPAVWASAQPARSGRTEVSFARIVERALALRDESAASRSSPSAGRPGRSPTLARVPTASKGKPSTRGPRTDATRAGRSPGRSVAGRAGAARPTPPVRQATTAAGSPKRPTETTKKNKRKTTRRRSR